MKPLPSYREIKSHFPLPPKERQFIEESRQTIRNILNGKDSRRLLIVGPCSIHDPVSAKEYAEKLRHLAQEVTSSYFLVMRTYFEKPRTSSGWKGFLYDPLIDGSCAIELGIQWSRQLLLEITARQVPAASEFLDPLTAFYYDDLISWGSIGARTASSQPHRHLASALGMPVGIKNGLAGNLSAAVYGALTASLPQSFVRLSETGRASLDQTKGNSDVHIVLRGGEERPNFDAACVQDALSLLEKVHLPPRLLIDCAHHNANKRHEQQPQVFRDVIAQIRQGNSKIKGLMLESHLQAGNQIAIPSLPLLEYGLSITDPCLDWTATQQLIEETATLLSSTSPITPSLHAI